MRCRNYSDISSAGEMVSCIERGGIQDTNTAYRELLTIVLEWESITLACNVQRLIDREYSEKNNIALLKGIWFKHFKNICRFLLLRSNNQ